MWTQVCNYVMHGKDTEQFVIRALHHVPLKCFYLSKYSLRVLKGRFNIYITLMWV